MLTALNADERETVVTSSDGDDLVHVWTAQRAVIGRLRRDPAFTEVETGHHGSTEWAAFTIPADRWTPAGVKRVRRMTDAQKQAGAERLRAANAARAAG
jgi:hypothetical protein